MTARNVTELSVVAILSCLICMTIGAGFAADLPDQSQGKAAESDVYASQGSLRPAIPTEGKQSSDSVSNGGNGTVLTQQAPQTTQKSSSRKNFIPEEAPTGASSAIIRPSLTDDKDRTSQAGPTAAVTTTPPSDRIALERPSLKALISVNDYLSPFNLDAESAQSTTLRKVLLEGIDRNLDLAISCANTKVQQWNYYNSLGKFLPDLSLGYREFFSKGAIGLPFNTFTSSLGQNSNFAGSGAFNNFLNSRPDTTIHIDTPFILMNAGITYYAYRGGRILFGSLQAKHNYRSAKASQNATLSDTLFNVTKDYYNLVLSEAILQIRIQAVRTSEEQLRNNTNRFHSGLATNLDVLQSKTQLSRDRQTLVDQQTNRRSAAITLSQALNANLGVDLIPSETAVRKVRLIDPGLTVADLLRIAVDNRPELRQYEELRLAAKRAIIVAGAPLHPTVSLSGNILGVGPPSNVEALFSLGVNVNWKLAGMGTTDVASIQAARWQARQAHLQANKELVSVLAQVRSSILQSLDSERNIEEASSEVTSSAEELRLAQLRFKSGLGTNLDIITAQRDYTQALVDKAQAMINFNIAQAQLLHDIGLASVDALSSGRVLSK